MRMGSGMKRMAKRRRLIRVLEPGLGLAAAVAWSPDGTRLAVAGGTGVAVLTTEGRALWSTQEYVLVYSVAWSPDGQSIADALGSVRDAHSGDIVVRLEKAAGGPSYAHDVAWSPDGSSLAGAGNDTAVHIHDARTGRQVGAMVGHEEPVWGVSWSPDGRRIVSTAEDLTVRVWNAASGEAVFVSPPHTPGVCRARWSPDGRTIAAPSEDEAIRLWDVSTYEYGTLSNGDARRDCFYACWAQHSRTLASEGPGSLVSLWDVDARRCVARLEGHAEHVWWVAFSPDGTRLASASQDGTVNLWDTTGLGPELEDP